MRVLHGGTLLLLAVTGCQVAPHVVLRVEDPDALAVNAVRLAAGRALDSLTATRIEKLPAEITVVGDEPGEVTLWVEARADNGEPLARGRARVTLSRRPQVAVAVRLAAACTPAGVDGARCVLGETLELAGVCIDGACLESVCGDGVTDPDAEVCDEGANNSNQPNADCRPDCTPRRCGDGVRDVGETCDGTDLGSSSCFEQGYYGGTLGCADDCQPDVTGCTGFCGDGTINGNEECDTDVSATCADFGFGRGVVICTSDCAVSTAGCSGGCGDGIVDPGELCDTTELDGHTCQEIGYYTGTPTCAGSCDGLNPTGCSGRCGDNVTNGTETCDGTDLPGGWDCTSFIYYGGTLGCGAGCDGFDTVNCVGFCGDGVINGGEECDGLDHAGVSCADLPLYTAGRLGCSSTCERSFGSCFSKTAWHVVNWGTGVNWHGLWVAGPGEIFVAGNNGQAAHMKDGNWALLTPRYLTSEVETVHYLAVWGSSPSDVHLVGDARGFNATVFRWDGNGWAGTWGPLDWNDVWGTSASEAFAVGSGGRVATWDGNTWTTTTAPTTALLNGVWGSGSTEVFAVGGGGTLLRYAGYGGASLEWQAIPYPYPTSQAFFDVWGTSSLEVFVVGDEVALRWDGGSWLPMSGVSGRRLVSVWGSSGTDVYAAAGNEILHYDGNVAGSWSVAPVAPAGLIRAVGGASSSEVYAVGDRGEILFFNGTAWSTLAEPTCSLRDISGVGVGNAFAVGDGGCVMHYDGAGWTRMTTPTSERLYSVWAHSATDVVAVGAGATAMRYGGPGVGWQAIDLSAPLPTPQGLHDIWRNSAGDSFVVGANGTCLHHNASTDQWSLAPSLTTQSLEVVWGDDAGEVWAGGDAGTLLHFESGTWSCFSCPLNGDYFTSMWGAAPDDIWAGRIDDFGYPRMQRYNGVGWAGVGSGFSAISAWGFGPIDTYFGSIEGGMFHYDGAAVLPLEVGSGNWLEGIWGSSPLELFAVGEHGTILHRRVTEWTAIPTGAPEDLHAAWGDGDILAAGANGTIMRYDGTGWTPEASNTGAALHAVWGDPPDFFAAGDGGAIVHDDGGGWTLSPNADNRTLRGMWGRDAADLFAVGDDGAVLHYDGTQWDPEPIAATDRLNAIWGSPDGHLFAVGELGSVWQFDGSWASVPSGVTSDLHAVWGTLSTDVYVAGDGGTLLRFDGATWSPLTSNSTADLRAVVGRDSANIMAAGMAGEIIFCDGTSCAPMSSATTSDLFGLANNSVGATVAVGAGGEARVWLGGMPTAYGGACHRPATAYCGTTLTGSTAGRAVRTLPIGCAGARSEATEKVFYRFDSPVDGELTALLTPHGGGDLDLIATGALTTLGCDPAGRCIEAAQTAGSGPEQITLTIAADDTYFFIIDGPGGAVGYTLELSCSH